MRILRKSHFWQDKRTFFEITGELPKPNERGYLEEGSINIRIGDEEGVRAAFKLSADEARAVVDTIKKFLDMHDEKMMHVPEKKEQDIEPASFNIFDTPKKEEKDEPRLQFYY